MVVALNNILLPQMEDYDIRQGLQAAGVDELWDKDPFTMQIAHSTKERGKA